MQHSTHRHHPPSVEIRDGQVVDQLEMVEAKLLERGDGVLVAQTLGLVPGHEHKLLLQQPRALGHAVLGCRGRIRAAEVDDETLLDAEDGVRRLVRVATEVEGAGGGCQQCTRPGCIGCGQDVNRMWAESGQEWTGMDGT